jgi:hypothetical protein
VSSTKPAPLNRTRKNRNSREFKEVQEKIREGSFNICTTTNSTTTNSLEFLSNSLTGSPIASGCSPSINSDMRVSRSRSSKFASQTSLEDLERRFREGFIDDDADETVNRWAVLRSISIFNERPDLISQQLKAAIHFEIFRAGSCAQKQGEPIDKIFWILQGSFVVQQEVEFITNEKGLLKQYKKSENLSSNEVITKLAIEAQKLSTGDWFSYLPPFSHNANERDVVDLCLRERSNCSIISQEESNVAWIYIEDLINCSSFNAIDQLNLNPIFRFNLEFLEEELIEQNFYAELRKNCPTSDSNSLY